MKIPIIPLILGAILLFSSGFYIGQNQHNSSQTPLILSEPMDEIRVHISGAVQKEGLYYMDRNACVQDAIQKAGGLLNDADQHQINLARPLRNGEKLFIPFQPIQEQTVESSASSTASSSTTASTSAPSTPQDSRININRASINDLTTLPGIGPAKAQAIVDFRERNGFFISIEDLINVPGIGPKTLENLQALIRVD